MNDLSLTRRGVLGGTAALSVAAFIFGFAALHDRQVLFGVHTGPGATAFTRIFFSANACDNDRVKAIIAPLVDE